ncbi:MAG TPA: aminopeptidase P family protein [Chitinophagales bacterium]|nr:aminopeptidase P family protein [Chitinophagales bacterium]HNK98223.1 aminopeptidase P family protein [Chitinophagales bacterium]
MKYLPIDSQLFVQNRKQYTSHLKPNSIAIFNSNDEMPFNADQTHPWKQNSDIFYLSGIDQEETILLIYPESPNPKYREALFLKKTNEHIAIWEGHKYTEAEARAASGIETIHWVEDFNTVFPMLMNHAEHVYLNTNENDRASIKVPTRDTRFIEETKLRFPMHKYERSAPIMAKLRTVKSIWERDLMQIACDITNKAYRRVLNFVKPGVMEFEIEAEIQHEFLRNRGTRPAYGSIIASGPSACVLHYVDNNLRCNDGDLLLMDFGVEYANYCADLTRTIPVSGKFTQRQKDVYNAVLRVQKKAIDMMHIGMILKDFNAEVGKVMESELLGLGLISKQDIADQNPEWPAFKKYFMHGTGHFLGLDVHDIGDHYQPIPAGAVLTCEPGIYIREEGIGIRIENDIMLMPDGSKYDFMKDTPSEVEEIETIMNSK